MYIVEVNKKAKKEIERLPTKDRQRVLKALQVLWENPFVGKKLEGEYEDVWTLRVWPYRILYVIYRERVTVVVIRVGHRQGVYK